MTTTTITPTHRGTSNTNSRGSSYSRRVRRQWLMDTFGNGTTCPCSFCGKPLQNVNSKAPDYITVDRIVPGTDGGTYKRGNIRPACGSCNSEDGGRISAGYRLETHTTMITV